jgi:hypothetical protein
MNLQQNKRNPQQNLRRGQGINNVKDDSEIDRVLEGKSFPVATVANGDVHRALAVGLVVIDPRLIQIQFISN